ncbi:MAG TPA: FAD-linked oxidase C-terminal domain-containing protein [Nocardioidaceae bacterium]|jgi:glycolate oxidase|nr:FAD-linked oxidase C-terminal domain-containing protein [Nocardioidaceae bacterium]
MTTHPTSDQAEQSTARHGADDTPTGAADAQTGADGAAVAALIHRLTESFGERSVLTDEAQRRTYECDGLAAYSVVPAVVVLTTNAEQVREVVAGCHELGVPFVARGSGTGLSGGALPVADGALIVLSQMRDILHVDPLAQRAVVQPGVINLDVTAAAKPHGYYYAPDPSSQQICSIGGNVAENSGGAHCLKYGFTTNHVLAVDMIAPDGQPSTLGTVAPDAPGYDLLGTVVGSEGTLGVVTEVTVRLTRLPEKVTTLLAGFRSTDDAGTATSAIIGAGVVPAAIEMMDQLAIEAAEEAVQCGYPEGARAVLVIELDGPAPEVDAQLDEVLRHCEEAGAFEVRQAQDDTERALIWRGRKSAFAAVGRISPDYIVQDGVIPRTALSEVLHRIDELADEAGIRVANVFHAGDGNLHPLVLFDAGQEGETERAEEVSGSILRLCLEHGGSITGEHGVGADKAPYMAEMFGPDDLDTMQLLRCAFDPRHLSNPGKVFPTPRLCGERPGRRQGAHPLQEAGLAEVF